MPLPEPPTFTLAFQHHQAGRLPEAEAIYRQILATDPTDADTLHFLGVLSHQTGRNEIAVDLIQKSIAIRPDNYASHSNLGEALRALGRWDDAIASYHSALRLHPRNAGTYFNLGIARQAQGRLDDAIAAYRQAIDLNPSLADAGNNLGSLLHQRGEIDEAVSYYRQALRAQPHSVPALNNLGNALLDLRQPDEAIAVYRQALALDSTYAETPTNLGVALAARGDLDAAEVAHRRSLEIQPGYAEAHSNLGNVLKDQGRLDEAVASYRHATQLQPGNPWLQSNLIYCLHFQPAPDDLSIAGEQRLWNQRFCAPFRQSLTPHPNVRDPQRRLRLGYISPDFRDHVIGRSLLPLFRHHDRVHFEVFCYSDVLQPDALTEEFGRHADCWRRTVGLSHAAVADLIRHDAVDILIDLTQHLAHNRLPVFARQPAPVQVSFAGYPASTGLETIRYRLTDRWLEAAEAAAGDLRTPIPHLRVAEQLFLLPSFWCYEPCGIDIPVNDLPATTSGDITFGSLNNFCKINEPLLDLWSRILGQIPNSRLVLLSHPGLHRLRVTEFLERQAISPLRIAFVEPCLRRPYLELYHHLDIALDPFPYGGHTTTLDALWMGVPVISLAGNSALSRAGLSILSNLGLPELATTSPESYVTTAVALARDLSRLKDLRATLRPRLKASPLMNAPHFTQQIEQAFRAMWQHRCENWMLDVEC